MLRPLVAPLVARLVLGLALGLAMAVAVPGPPARAQQAQPGYMSVSGQVVTSRGVPIPGVTVQLLSPDVGASYPVTTGPNGEYFFPHVPTNVRNLYVIRVLWGSKPIYQGVVDHPGTQRTIVIQVP
jgi:hypothetical protein